MIRAGDIYAATCAHSFRQRQPIGYVFQIRAAFLRIRVEHVDPGSDFSDHHIFSGERFLDRSYEGAVLRRGLRAVGGAVTKSAMFASQFSRVFAFEENGPS